MKDKDNQCKLMVVETTKANSERFLNCYLVWSHNDKVYRLKVRPTFNEDFRLMLAHAVFVPNGEPLEKYL